MPVFETGSRGFESCRAGQGVDMNNAYRKFQPITTSAADTVRELTTRGGIIVVDKKEYVEIRRMDSVARIDQLGRVEWRQGSHS